MKKTECILSNEMMCLKSGVLKLITRQGGAVGQSSF